jgi:hypothetical protein
MAAKNSYAVKMRELTHSFASWPPTEPRAIGDFGLVKDGVFQFYGRLSAPEIASLGSRDGPPARWDLTYKATRGLNTDAKARAEAGVVEGKALLEVGFNTEDAFMFTAPDVRIKQVEDLITLGRLLNQRRLEGDWNMDHAVVVEVSTATTATIVLSEQNGANLKLEIDAKAPVTAEVVANLKADAAYLDSKGVGVRLIGEGPLTPLFKLAFLRKRLVQSPEIAYRDGTEMKPTFEAKIDDEHVLRLY